MQIDAFFTLHRLLDFPFTREYLLTMRGIDEYTQYYSLIRAAKERSDPSVGPPELPQILQAAGRSLGRFAAVERAGEALNGFIVHRNQPRAAVESARRFADVMEGARRDMHAQGGQPGAPPQPPDGHGGVFAGGPAPPPRAAPMGTWQQAGAAADGGGQAPGGGQGPGGHEAGAPGPGAYGGRRQGRGGGRVHRRQGRGRG